MISKIKYYGIEFEGCWENEPCGFKGDGSVYFNDESEDENYIGEVASIPLTEYKLYRWIKENYPSHTNKSCGLHVHLSFTTNYAYQRLMSKQFFDKFIDSLEKWGTRR